MIIINYWFFLKNKKFEGFYDDKGASLECLSCDPTCLTCSNGT